MSYETLASGQGLACYGEMCFCALPKRLWPWGVKGTDNVFEMFECKPGRIIDGKFYAEPVRDGKK